MNNLAFARQTISRPWQSRRSPVRTRKTTRNSYFAQGNAAFEKQQYADSILAYKNALRADPKFAPARQKLAEALEKGGDFAASTREYVRAADLLTDDAAAQITAARSLLRIGQFEDASSRAKRGLAIDAKNIEGHIVLGNAIAATKDLEGAIEQIREAIEIDPTRSASHTSLGAIFFAKGQRPEAQASFERAVELDPKSEEARLALATYFMVAGELSKAEVAIKEALAVTPNSARANQMMALLLTGTGKAPEAEKAMQTAVATVGTPDADLTLADYYLRLNKPDSARPILERLAQSDRLFVRAAIRLASIDYVAGRRSEAHHRLDDVLKRAPADSGALVTKGGWLLSEGRGTEALPLLQAAVKSNPRSASAQFVLGRALMATGDHKGAEEEFAESSTVESARGCSADRTRTTEPGVRQNGSRCAIARDAVTNQPRNTAARVRLIRGLIARRDYERASTELAPLVKSFPDHPTIKSLNGTLLLARNDVAGARQAYEAALQKNAGELDALSGLATIEARTGQLDRSRARLSEQLGRTPDNTPLLTLAAQVDLRAGDFASGEQRLRRVIQIDPASQRELRAAGAGVLEQRKLDEAANRRRRAQREPKSVGAYIMIGTSSMRRTAPMTPRVRIGARSNWIRVLPLWYTILGTDTPSGTRISKRRSHWQGRPPSA